ncbi:MAG: ShlB/FhaC/HecB family hemolysin secretion/activation protein, partial [Desulfobacteraceae bacterium]
MIHKNRITSLLQVIIVFAFSFLALSGLSVSATDGGGGSDSVKSPSGTDSVFVKEFRFTGNTVIDTDTLKSLTKEFTERELTLDEMKVAADLVTIAYQEKGYILAKAVVPKQDITDGVLNILIQEGDVGKVTTSGNTYYRDRVIKRYFIPQIKAGVVQEDALERAVLLTNDIPKNETRVVLKKGEKPGTSDMELQTKDEIGFKWGVDYNNFGTDLISRNRYGSFMEFTDPFWGSTLEVRGISGRDRRESGIVSASYRLPVNTIGSAINLKYLKANYGVGQQFADLGLEGDTKVYGANISTPLVRSRNANFYYTLGVDHKYQKNLILNEQRSIDEVSTLYMSFDFDNLDRFLGKNFISFSFIAGDLDPDDRIPPSRLRAEEDDKFMKMNLSLARIQRLYESINLLVRFYGQTTNSRVVPFEQFVIGGYGSVRGHEPALFIGDSGYTFSTELMFPPPFLGQKSLFGQRVAQMVQ